jgi:hypothetical protein
MNQSTRAKLPSNSSGDDAKRDNEQHNKEMRKKVRFHLFLKKGTRRDELERSTYGSGGSVTPLTAVWRGTVG